MRFLAFFSVIFFVTGCGGNGSAAPAILNIDGTWRGNLTLMIDQCLLKMDSLPEVHQVFIDADSVTLISTDGRTLDGMVTSSTAFDVKISDGAAFPTIDEIAYSGISNGHAHVEVSHTLSRPGGCFTSWSGEMVLDGN